MKTKFDAFSDDNPGLAARLEERHKRIVTANRDAIEGRTVLDLAANNGRWSYYAADAGAKRVVSIEGRDNRVDEAKRIFGELGLSDRIEPHVGDMYDWLHDTPDLSPDTVFCLGVFYHVMDHYMLLRLIARHNPKTIILDSGFVRSFRNSVHIQTENPARHLNTLAAREGQKAELVGFVSLGLAMQMAWNLGYSCRPVVWDPSDISERKAVQDYLGGRRFTLRLDLMEGFTDPDWKQHWRPALTALNPRFVNLLDPATHDSAVDVRVSKPFDSMAFTVF